MGENLTKAKKAAKLPSSGFLSSRHYADVIFSCSWVSRCQKTCQQPAPPRACFEAVVSAVMSDSWGFISATKHHSIP